MTVLYFADTRFPIERANGAQTMATCRALASRGHAVTLVVRPDTALPSRDPFEFYGLPRHAGLSIVAVPAMGGVRMRRLEFLLASWRRGWRLTSAVVYTRDLGVASCLLRLPRPVRPRLIYESHGLAPVVSAEMPRLLGRPDLGPTALKTRRLEGRERLVWKRASAYVTITRALADELTARYGPRKSLFVVPDGADAPGPAADHQSGGPIVAAYAGHLYPWKGVDVFVRALACAPAVRGLIVGGHPGEPDRARVEHLARELGLTNRVDFTGQVPPASVATQLAVASMLVLPNSSSAISERYTSPLKLFEYLWLGKPIVASDLPAIREILTEACAVFVPPGDAAALGAALQQLATDPARASALGTAARRLAPDYTWARRAERLEPALAAAGDAR